MALSPEMATITIALGVSLAAFGILWLISLRVDDASIVDWYWGIGFAVIAWIGAFRHAPGAETLFLVALVTLWSVRLTGYMVARHHRKGREDARYAAMRAAGGPNFKRDSLFTIFILQAIVMWLVAAPLHAVFVSGMPAMHPVIYGFGIALFSAGFTIESIADFQLERFTSNPANDGKLMTSGLFALCRHPNYFGESMLWWGIGIISFAISGLWWALIGPSLLTFLLLKVSGVTMLDKHLSSRPGWQAYQASTPAFFPRWPAP